MFRPAVKRSGLVVTVDLIFVWLVQNRRIQFLIDPRFAGDEPSRDKVLQWSVAAVALLLRFWALPGPEDDTPRASQ